MQTRSKIAAFTMMDIMTGMVIMSIVIAMVFYLFTSTNQQAFTYQKIRIDLNDYMLLKADLKLKSDVADKIEGIPLGFQLISEKETIAYIKMDNVLIRKTENSQDTLYKNVNELNLIEEENQLPNNGNPLITGVNLKLQFDEQILSCYLYKDYGLTAPINQKLVREF